MALPVVLLLVLEAVLRLCNYGYNTALFVKDPHDQTSWVMNPDASAKFFSNLVNATRGNHERFKIQKEPKTFRVFVLGESTTAGYPYMHNGSFHRWLQYRFMHTFPERKFEIINVSLTAVNSYTVLDFGKQVINYQPDAVLVYTGHNEYYGALGIGSTSGISGSHFWVQTVLKLREFKLVQALSRLIYSIQHLGHKPTDTRENLMKRMAATQQIMYGSADYHKGINQFRQNMEELCQLYSDKKVPLVISNLVSNEKDLKPFISSKGQMSASQVYQTALDAYGKGNYSLAKASFEKASDYDLLRFRAPGELNTIIEQLGRQYPGVYIANTRKLFEEHSPHGILGNETLLEHVHPNIYGYALMSEAFYQAMRGNKIINPKPENEMLFKQLLKQMPVTRVDSLYGAYQIMMLKTGWPFNTPIPSNFKRGDTEDEKIAGALSVDRITWADAMDQLFKYDLKNNNKAGALKATEAMLLENPDNVSYYIYAGRLNFDLGNKPEAFLYFAKAYQLEPSLKNARNNYLLCLKLDEPQKALTYLNLMRGYNTPAAQLDEMESQINQLIKLKQQLKKEPSNFNLNQQIAACYHRLNADEAATIYQHTPNKNGK
jgi:lysophospholipase L1-like esterase